MYVAELEGVAEFADLPGSVLFACTQNSLRSPMAEALMKYLHGRQIYVQSVGVRPGEIDPFVLAVLDAGRERDRPFDSLDDVGQRDRRRRSRELQAATGAA